MAGIRYQVPPDLFDTARKNLAQADASISKFNQTAAGVSRIPYATTTTAPASSPSDPSAFKFPSIGGPVDTSLGAPPPDAFSQPSIANSTTSAPPVDNSNWRFRSFGPSQLSNNGGSMDKPYATSPDAYGQTVSSPVVPANWKPRDMTESQKKYGWGTDNLDSRGRPTATPL